MLNKGFFIVFVCVGLIAFNWSLAEEKAELIVDNRPHVLHFDDQYYSWSDNAIAGDISSQKTTSNNYQRLLVGLKVNHQEVATIGIIQTADDFLLPIDEVFPYIQARYNLLAENSDSSDLEILVPTGSVRLLAKETYSINGKIWLAMRLLNQKLLLKGIFDQTQYAIKLFPPWQKPTSEAVAQQKPLAIERKPESFSLRQFQLSHQVQAHGSDVINEYSEFIASGAALDGAWRLEAEKNQQRDWYLDEYFWLKKNQKSQWLLGKQTVSPSVLSPAVTLTGAQYFYGNKEIPYDSYNDISQSVFFRQLGNSVQKILGQAEAGTLAQLYVNGSLQKEVFVRLDGTYDFGEVQLSSSLFNEIEVWIVDSVNRVIIEKQNKTQANSEYLLDEGQFVSSLALGKKGNLLDQDYEDEGEAGMFLTRYGLSDRTTVEVGYLLDDRSVYTLGIASALGSNFVSALRFAERNNAHAAQAELNGYGDKWRLNTYLRYQEPGFSEFDKTETSSANLNYYYMVNPKFRWELVGRHYQSDSQDINFLKPGFYYRATDSLSFASRPDADGLYRSELYYQPQRAMRLRLVHRPDVQTGRFDWDLGDQITTYLSSRRYDFIADDGAFKDKQTEKAVGFYWRPDYWDPYTYFRAEANHNEEYGYGAYLEWRSRLFSGVYFDLRVQDGAREYGGGLSLLARISFDFAMAGGSFMPARNRTSYSTDGTIAGKLITDSGQCDMDKVSVLLNRYSYTALVRDCSFYLQRIKPGIYRVGLDAEHLPIELIPESSTYVIQVATSAITRVDFKLHSEYNAAGKVIDAKGDAQANMPIRLLNQQGDIVMETYSDQFGYYRVDGLSNGLYQVQLLKPITAEQEEKTPRVVLVTKPFEIRDDFLFDLNLVLKP